MRLFPLLSLPIVVHALAAQDVRPATRPNWVDTIKVDRLPTGGCHWSAAARQMRPGDRGTTTRQGALDEKTCTVLFLNYTTGSATAPPATIAFAAMEDHKLPIPPGAVLNFADTFTVARRPDGSCDWGRTPVRQGPPGSSSRLGEARTTTCWGVVHNLSLTASSPAQEAMKSDTVTIVSPSRGPMTPPERMQLADAVVQKQFAPGERIEITNRRFKGDSAWVNVQHTPTSWTIFTLVWVNDAWKVAQRTASSR